MPSTTFWQRLIEPYRAGDWDECIRRARRAVDAEPFEPSPRQLLARLYTRVDHPRLALLHYEKLMPIAVGRGDLFRALAIQRQIDALLPPGAAPLGRYTAMQRWFRMVGRSLGIPSDPASDPGFTPAWLLALPPQSFEEMAAEMGVEELDLTPLEANTEGGAVWALVMGRLRWSLESDEPLHAPELIQEGAQMRIEDEVRRALLRLEPEVPSECLRFDADLIAKLMTAPVAPTATDPPRRAAPMSAPERDSGRPAGPAHVEPADAADPPVKPSHATEPSRAAEPPPKAKPSVVPDPALTAEPLRAAEPRPRRRKKKGPPRPRRDARNSHPGEFDGSAVRDMPKPKLTIGVPASEQSDLSAIFEAMDFSIIDLNGPVPESLPEAAGPSSNEQRTFELYELEPWYREQDPEDEWEYDESEYDESEHEESEHAVPEHSAEAERQPVAADEPTDEPAEASLPPVRDEPAEPEARPAPMRPGPSASRTPESPTPSAPTPTPARPRPPEPVAPPPASSRVPASPRPPAPVRPQPTPESDRRRHLRVTVALGSRVALVGMRDRSFAASVIDLSAAGLALSLELDEVGSVLRALDGSVIRLELQLPPDGRRLELAGRVRSVGQSSDGETARVGVEFVMLTESDRAALRLAVDRIAQNRSGRAA